MQCFKEYKAALEKKELKQPAEMPEMKITAQGGVGTTEEHNFLLDYYDMDGVGWATPFMLVPEVISIDTVTMNLLAKGKEKDFYYSGLSPLGVPFNSLKGNSKDLEKLALIEKGRPGSSCPKKFLVSTREFTEKIICTASRQYQRLKIKELDSEGLSPDKYQNKFEKIIDKECICVGLGSSALLVNNIDSKFETGVSVCPGPNLAYFSKTMSIKQITDHIYSRSNMITRTDRPNMFIKELDIYIEFLKNKIEEIKISITNKQEKYLLTFVKNLNEGINYYYRLFTDLKDVFEDTKSSILSDLNASRKTLHLLNGEIENQVEQ